MKLPPPRPVENDVDRQPFESRSVANVLVSKPGPLVYWSSDVTLGSNVIASVPITGYFYAMPVFIREDCILRRYVYSGTGTMDFEIQLYRLLKDRPEDVELVRVPQTQSVVKSLVAAAGGVKYSELLNDTRPELPAGHYMVGVSFISVAVAAMGGTGTTGYGGRVALVGLPSRFRPSDLGAAGVLSVGLVTQEGERVYAE